MSQARNIAIIGASGNVGSFITSALLKHPAGHNLTLITRHESTSKNPFGDTVKVIKGDYQNVNFFADALKGQDAVIITLAFTADQSVQTRIIEGAAKAGVTWILPNEWGSDNSRDHISDIIPGTALKKQYRDLIVKLGVSSFIGVVTNPWIYFYFLPGFIIDTKARTARFWDEGETKTIINTYPQIGKSVAALLSLPDAQLEKYKNDFVYLKSFRVTQRELLDAAQRATATTDADWTIEKTPLDEAVAKGRERMAAGDFTGAQTVLFASMLKPDFGGDYQVDRRLLNDDLGLGTEDLDDVVGAIVRNEGPGYNVAALDNESKAYADKNMTAKS